MRGALAIVRHAFSDWRSDNAGRLGAALSYYTLFSLAPLLVVAIAVAGFFFGRDAAQGQIVAQIQGLIGEAGARAVQDMIDGSRRPAAGVLATAISLATLLLGATGAFTELKSALNVVWDVKDEGGGIRALLRGRLWAFAMVLAVGFLLIVSLLISAAVAAADGFFEWVGIPPALVHLANGASSFVVITVLFALLFKYLPDTEVAWRDVWLGAAVTSALFTIGKALIGLYLGRSSVASVYGAAGSVVVIIVWVYYAAQIFFFGAEVTQAYAHRQRAQASLESKRGQAPARSERSRRERKAS